VYYKERKREREKERKGRLIPSRARDLGTDHHLVVGELPVVAPAEVPPFGRDEGFLLSFSPFLFLSL